MNLLVKISGSSKSFFKGKEKIQVIIQKFLEDCFLECLTTYFHSIRRMKRVELSGILARIHKRELFWLRASKYLNPGGTIHVGLWVLEKMEVSFSQSMRLNILRVETVFKELSVNLKASMIIWTELLTRDGLHMALKLLWMLIRTLTLSESCQLCIMEWSQTMRT